MGTLLVVSVAVDADTEIVLLMPIPDVIIIAIMKHNAIILISA
jgi:hypothetical protein